MPSKEDNLIPTIAGRGNTILSGVHGVSIRANVSVLQSRHASAVFQVLYTTLTSFY